MTDKNMTCGGAVRSLGSDKYRVAELAAAEARGMHDAGVLTVGKHFPGMAESGEKVDTHMGEAISYETREELLDYKLYPYVKLIEEGLLDGVMMGHSRFVNVDPEYPASLSPTAIGILRDIGFDGLAVTDALGMMGVVAKYGKKNSVGLAVAGGADMALPFINCNEKAMGWLLECYREGMICDAKLDGTVRRVLAAQHKVMSLTEPAPITNEEKAAFERLNTDSVFARTDESLSVSLDQSGRYCFAILTEQETDLRGAEIGVDTMKNQWYDPAYIASYLHSHFPNSNVTTISEYPTADRLRRFLQEGLGREVVFITFFNSQCYIGAECFTSRILSLMNAMQVSNRISTILHFGNPFLLEDVPHIPRVIVGTISAAGVRAGLEVLAGEREAKGSLTYPIRLQ
jgi:beta-glucosidase-like glycosyl hydrolase